MYDYKNKAEGGEVGKGKMLQLGTKSVESCMHLGSEIVADRRVKEEIAE
jgi:hypothetical protein